MNKLISKIFLALGLVLIGSIARADNTFTNIWDGLTAEPHATIGESAIPIYVYDLNNGESRGGGVTPFYKVGPFSLDTGFVTPLDASKTGTPVLGGSVHVDQLIRILNPAISNGFRALFPLSASKLMDALVIGVAPIKNWNTPENESSLIIAVYSGLELHF